MDDAMGQYWRDVLRDEYDFSEGEIGRHHAAYRRRKSAVRETRVRASRDSVRDSHETTRERHKSAKQQD